MLKAMLTGRLVTVPIFQSSLVNGAVARIGSAVRKKTFHTATDSAASRGTMRAALYREFGGPIKVETVPRPAAQDGGVVVELRANGICRSDWHGWRGHDGDIRKLGLPHVPGHELSGVVAEVGSGVDRFRVGDRVVAPFILSCGSCHECSELRQPTVCSQQRQPGFHFWGSFAEFAALPRADLNLSHLPADIDFDAASSLGCRYTTAYRAVVSRGAVSKGSTLAVIGCGGVGLSAVMIGKAFGARVVAMDVSQGARSRATALGADEVFDSSSASSNDQLREMLFDVTSGGADVAVEAAGTAQSVAAAVLSLRRGGRMVQAALPLGKHDWPPVPMALVAGWELELVGSHGAEATDLPRVMALISEGRLRPGDLITERVSLSAACGHLMAMDAEDANGGSVRTIVDFQN